MYCLRDMSFGRATKRKRVLLESKHEVGTKSSVMLIVLGNKQYQSTAPKNIFI